MKHPAPFCGCCRTSVGSMPIGGVWRCPKHVDRIPCIIDGCGRTFALREGEDYSWVTICGTHWRMAPKRMRDLVSAIRRKANRIAQNDRKQWPAKLAWQHHRVWEKCRRAIVRALAGDIDVAEINRVMGWDQ